MCALVCMCACHGGRVSECGHKYVCRCIHEVCQKTRKEEAIHLPTTSPEGQLVNCGFERSDHTILKKCGTKQRGGKRNKETGNDQAFPVFSKYWESRAKRIRSIRRNELVKESNRRDTFKICCSLSELE